MELVKKTVKNVSDVDIYVRDCFGQEHIVFPQQERDIVVLKNKRRRDDGKRASI